MYRICVVCTGNICRSPMAASVLRGKVVASGLADRVDVSSAGTYGLHAGSPMDPRAAAILARHGYSTDHVARQFSPADFARLDLILVTDRTNLEHLSDLATRHGMTADLRLIRSFDPSHQGEQGVPDPFNGGPEDFAKVLGQLERACDGLVAQLLSDQPPA